MKSCGIVKDKKPVKRKQTKGQFEPTEVADGFGKTRSKARKDETVRTKKGGDKESKLSKKGLQEKKLRLSM